MLVTLSGSTISVMLAHPSKALSAISSPPVIATLRRLWGTLPKIMLKLVYTVASEKTPLPTKGRVMLCNASQPSKARLPILWTLSGTVTAVRAEQFAKASLPISVNPPPIETDCNEVQP